MAAIAEAYGDRSRCRFPVGDSLSSCDRLHPPPGFHRHLSPSHRTRTMSSSFSSSSPSLGSQFVVILVAFALIALWSPSAAARAIPPGTPTDTKAVAASLGFEEVKVFMSLQDWNITAVHYRHIATGANFVSISNNDPSKYFAISLKTLASNDYGAPHVLEHCVLMGSRKYPVRGNFYELDKFSVGTLNAETAADNTLYELTTTYTKDLYNHLDMVLDGVLHPEVLKNELIFRREGWNYHLQSPNDTLTVEGVAWNEMLWRYSSSSFRLVNTINKVLFPDTPYAFESGGYPYKMINLTYEDLKDFHRRFYHPSNIFISMYGDDDAVERLRFLSGAFANFTYDEEVKANSKISPLSFNSTLPYTTVTFPSTGDDPQCFVMAWLLEMEAGLHMEDKINLELVEGLLKSALFQYGLDITFDNDNYANPVFYILFCNTTIDAPSLESGIMETFESAIKTGISDADVSGILINTLLVKNMTYGEYSLSNGKSLHSSMLAQWKRGGDPLEALNFTKAWASVFDRVTDLELVKPSFETMVQYYVLNNTNRAAVHLVPEAGGLFKIKAKLEGQLAAWQRSLSEDEIQQLVNNTRILDEYARPAGLSVTSIIPSLSWEDLKLAVPKQNDKVYKIGAATVVENYMDTHGFFYVDIAFDLARIPQDLIPYVGVLAHTWEQLSSVGPTELDTDSLFRISISVQLQYVDAGLKTARGEGQASPYFIISGKTNLPNASLLIDEIRQRWIRVQINNPAEYSGASPYWDLQSPGVAARLVKRLAAKDSFKGWFTDYVEGYRASNASDEVYAATLDTSLWPDVIAKLEEAYRNFIHSDGVSISVIGNQSAIKNASKALKVLVESLPSPPTPQLQRVPWTKLDALTNESVPLPLLAFENLRSRNVYKGGWAPAGSSSVITKVQNAWINHVVRVRRHAYGGGAAIDEGTGLVYHYSTADPQILRTLQTFDESANFLESITEMDEDLDRIKVTAVAQANNIKEPYVEGMSRFWDFLTNVTIADYERKNVEINTASLEDFKEFGRALKASVGVAIVTATPEALSSAEKQEPSLRFQSLI